MVESGYDRYSSPVGFNPAPSNRSRQDISICLGENCHSSGTVARNLGKSSAGHPKGSPLKTGLQTNDDALLACASISLQLNDSTGFQLFLATLLTIREK